MKKMDIRTLTDKQAIAEAITACAEAFHDQTCNDPAKILGFAEKFPAKAYFLAAYDDDEVKGFAAFYCNNYENMTAFISMIVVVSNYQYHGGTVLLSTVKDICKKNGMKKIRLEVADDNHKALSFYTKRNFVFEAAARKGTSFYVLSL